MRVGHQSKRLCGGWMVLIGAHLDPGLPATFSWVNRQVNHQPIRYQTRLSDDSQQHFKSGPERTAYATSPLVYTDGRPQGRPWPPYPNNLNQVQGGHYMQGGQYPQGRYVQGQQQKPDDSMNRRLLLVSQEKNPLKREKLVKVFTASLFNRWEALRKAIENVDYANDPGLALYMRHTPKEIAKNGNPVSDPYFKIVSEQGESAALVSPVQFDPREIDALQMLDYKWAEERKAIKRVRKDQYIKNQQQDVSFGS